MTHENMPEALQDMKRRAIGEKDSNGVMGPTWATPKEVLSLIAEIERLREDAERYAYLIEEHGYEMEFKPGVYYFCSDKSVVDQAIDAARKKY